MLNCSALLRRPGAGIRALLRRPAWGFRAWLRRPGVGFLSLGALALLGGCTHVIGNNCPYYKQGPAQREGPQGTIPAGTRVWVLGKEGSYARVWAANGVDGYVWDSSIVTVEEWNRRQELDKKNKEAERRARAKGDGPLGPPESYASPPASGSRP